MIIANLSIWSEFMCSVTEALLTLFIFFGNPHFLGTPELELELELILSQMAQKPMLRGEVNGKKLNGLI